MTGKATEASSMTSESIPEKECIGPNCKVKTSTPYAKVNGNEYLCSSACSKKYYAEAGTLGAWGSASTPRTAT